MVLVLAFASGLISLLRGDPVRDRLVRLRLGERNLAAHYVRACVDGDILYIFAVSPYSIRVYPLHLDKPKEVASTKVPEVLLDEVGESNGK